MHTLHYARLANKAYDVHSLADKEVSITVAAYDEDLAIAEKQARLLYDDLQAALEQENPGLRYSAMVERTRKMLSELFRGAARTIGEWPQSSAYYSVDVIYDDCDRAEMSGNEAEYTPAPRLIEVNFMGDWHGVEAAVKSRDDYQQWAEDLMVVLATRNDVSENERLIRL